MTRLESTAECSMCGWKTNYETSSASKDALELVHDANVVVDSMIMDHIKTAHTAFLSLFEAGRNEGFLISDQVDGSMNALRGMFDVRHTERRSE